MAKSARLTWGLSLCKLKIPSFVLDSGVGKSCLSSASSAAASAFKLKACPSSRRRHLQNSLRSQLNKSTSPSNDDLEISLIIDPPQLASHCTKGKAKMIQAGVSDPGMRFLVYLVSLALSLAALSILKLHKLLEWLLVDTDAPTVTARLQELRTKSALISEILRTAALRYTRLSGLDAPASAPATPTLPVASPQPLSTVASRPVVSVSTPPAQKRAVDDFLPTPGFCFHVAGLTATASEQCLLCLVTGVEGGICPPRPMAPRPRRSHSESELTKVRWSKPSRVNAGICRSQVASNPSTWSLSVELCSGAVSPAANKTGLCLATAVKNGANWLCRLASDTELPRHSKSRREAPTPAPLFSRSPKLVACVAPTSSSSPTVQSSPPSTPSRPHSLSVILDSKEFQKPVYQVPLFAVLEEEEELDLESALCLEEAHPMTLAAAVAARTSFSLVQEAKNTVTIPSHPTIRRDCGVEARVETRETASSPLLGCEDDEDADETSSDNPDAEGLELDDEGVYFAYDFPDPNALPSTTTVDATDLDGEVDAEIEETLEMRRTHSVEERYKGEGFSDLVALTNSISDDLHQLESGCQELIHRVHANRIELDRMHDSLSFVWDNKDECTAVVAAASSTTPEKDASSLMEKSWSASSCSGSVYTHQYTPMGASFISYTSSTGSCCACACHSLRVLEAVEDLEPSSSDLLSNLTVVPSESPQDHAFFHPSVSFEDDDAVAWCESNCRGSSSDLVDSSSNFNK